MRLALSEEQLLFGQAVRDLLEKRCGPDLVRAAWSESLPAGARALWRELAGIGVFGVLVPEAAGGLGFGEVELVPILEEVGRAAVPLPVAEAVIVGGALAAADGAPETVGAIVGGESLVAAAFPGDQVAPFAPVAEVVAVFEDSAVRLLGPGQADVAPVESVESVDRSRHLGRFAGPVAGGVVVEIGPEASALAFDRAALASSALLAGLSQHLLDVTVEYVKSRHQFGVPIGSFQAIKHRLADAHVALQFAKPAIYQAAYALANGWPTASRAVSMAKALASDGGRVVAGAALQCHGAMGYADEYDLHLWLKRVWALAASHGDAAWHRDRVGRALSI